MENYLSCLIMRITGGYLKGKEVLSFKDKEKTIRPTSSKVREALFNLLKHGKFLGEIEFYDPESSSLLESRTMLDLYSGTGMFSFESLSRGLGRAIMIDKNEHNINMAKKTAANLGVTDLCKFMRGNATDLPYATEQCDLVFLDPPYGKRLFLPTVKSVIKNDWLKKGGVIIAEHSKREDLQKLKKLETLDSRSYNNTNISILKFLG